jgi:tetraprenyl-beta-curcumene synthase
MYLRVPPARRASSRRLVRSYHDADPAPLTRGQLRVLLGSASRELAWGLPGVVRELRRWRSRALQIPEGAIRQDALGSLDRKRGNTHGAALFFVLAPTRSRCLLRLLVTYQVMWDFLDCVSESGAGAGQENGLQLHLALVEALDPSRPISDYYALHPWREDGGYLRALVAACRQCCQELPSIQKVRPVLLREATRANVQAINHDPDPAPREAALRNWVAREYPNRHDVSWFELSAAAGAGLAIYALFVLAAEPRCTATDVDRAHRAYFPWISALATMLDSFVDEAEDRANGDHCYVAYYRTPEHAGRRIAWLVRRCMLEARTFENSEAHTLVVACMTAMYLSKDSARTPAMKARARQIARSGGSLTRALLPILRLWRIANGQRST